MRPPTYDTQFLNISPQNQTPLFQGPYKVTLELLIFLCVCNNIDIQNDSLTFKAPHREPLEVVKSMSRFSQLTIYW